MRSRRSEPRASGYPLLRLRRITMAVVCETLSDNVTLPLLTATSHGRSFIQFPIPTQLEPFQLPKLVCMVSVGEVAPKSYFDVDVVFPY